MRSQVRRRPCVYCGTVTAFERVEKGKRGALHIVACCVDCGENSAYRRNKEGRAA